MTRKKVEDRSSTESNGDLVVVGSSAGGVTALSVFVNTLSTELLLRLFWRSISTRSASHLATIRNVTVSYQSSP
jgi:hypothetical protein